MIEKLDLYCGFAIVDWLPKLHGQRCAAKEIQTTVNQLIDAVNALQAEAESNAQIRANHEREIDELKKESSDQHAEQRKWIGCMVRYKIVESCQGGWYIDVLDEITDHPTYPFTMRNGTRAAICELVTPDEIYPHKARTW